MDGMDAAVMDDVVEDVVDQAVDDSADSGDEAGASDSTAQDGSADGESESASPYTTKFSREMRAALKQWEQANPEAAKFAKQARDNHARLFALTQLEPKGIDGVRERYALLDSLTHGDVQGSEALTAIQEELAAVEEVDNLLASGDPKAFDALGDDFNEGLAKLAPIYLDRVGKTDPEGLRAALAPYFAQDQAQLVNEYNALIDVLEAQNDPRFDEKTKMQFALTQLAKMGEWMNRLYDQNGNLKAGSPIAAKTGTSTSGNSTRDEQAQLERDRQELHWERSIYPQAASMVEEKFNELLRPLQARLKLTPKQRDAAFTDFKAKNSKLCDEDNDYNRQRNFYRKQRNPDSKAVLNMVRAQLAKTARNAFDEVKAERWEAFLAGKQKAAAQTTKPGVKQGPVSPNVEIRTVKPPMNEIDHRNTPVDWLAQKKYRLYSGKVVQVRAAQ